MKNSCRLFGVLSDDYYRKLKDITRRVYDPQGVAPTVNTFGGGNRETKIVVWK